MGSITAADTVRCHSNGIQIKIDLHDLHVDASQLNIKQCVVDILDILLGLQIIVCNVEDFAGSSRSSNIACM